jgi:hypothetical protein
MALTMVLRLHPFRQGNILIFLGDVEQSRQVTVMNHTASGYFNIECDP